MDSAPGTDSQFGEFWTHLLEDTAATAREYEKSGWDVLSLDPGDVTPLYDTDKPFGLSVLVPNPEFDRVDDLVSAGSFDNVEVYRNTVGPVVFLLVVERDESRETAVLVPAYYNYATDEGLLETARDEGEMRVHVRALGEDRKVTFVHDEVSLFAPESEEQDT